MNYELWTQVIRVVNTTKEHKQPSRRVRKTVLKMCSKFAGEHPCRSVILIKLQINFIEITLRNGCSPASLLHIFRTPFSKNTSRLLLLDNSFNFTCTRSIMRRARWWTLKAHCWHCLWQNACNNSCDYEMFFHFVVNTGKVYIQL